MTYGDFKDSPTKAAFDRVLRAKAFNIAKNSKHDEYQCGIVATVYNFLMISLLVVLLHMQINLLLKVKL